MMVVMIILVMVIWYDDEIWDDEEEEENGQSKTVGDVSEDEEGFGKKRERGKIRIKKEAEAKKAN